MKYIEDTDFNKENDLDKGEYENCVFKGCMLSGQQFKDYKFIDCEFIDSDLSNIDTVNTSFQNVQFTGCKLLGIRFDYCNPFLLSFKFSNCQLNFSSFFSLNLHKIHCKECDFKEVDFTNTILKESQFVNCKLDGSIFENTDLQGSDLSAASGFIIDPEKNNIRNCKFSLHGLPGLLSRHQIEIV